MHIRNPHTLAKTTGSADSRPRIGQSKATTTSVLRAAAFMLVGMVATLFAAHPALAGAGWGDTSNVAPDVSISAVDNTNAIKVRTYYANSPQGLQFDPLTGLMTRDTGKAMRKFVDLLPGLGGPVLDPTNPTPTPQTGAAGNLTDGTYIPVAAGDTTTYPGSVYYEIAVVEYTQRMHSDLIKATTLRGYVQIDPVATDALAQISGNPGVSPAGSKKIPLFQIDNVTPVLISRPSTGANAVDGFEQVQAVAVDKPSYLGPTIVATHGTPTRVKFYNGLPAGHGYTDGNGVWHRQGDLFIPVDHSLFGGGDGQTQTGWKNLLCGDVLSGPNNAGDPALSACAAMTLNGLPVPQGYVQVAAFEQYTENRQELHLHGGDNPWVSDGHPHQWITPAADEINSLVAPNYRRGEIAYNVPDMPNPGPGAVTYYWPNGQSGRLLFFHDHATGLTRLNVYAGAAAGYLLVDPSERALNALVGGREVPLVIQEKTFVPKDILPTAASPNGGEDAKWDTTHWGQEGDLWFPHVYETNQDPLSADATNPVGRWDGASFFWPVFPQVYATPSGEYGNASTTPEAFMDTPIINGMAYPTVTVAPKAYRFRILGVGNDRMLNLSLFVADSTVTGTPVANTEVKMVPFASPNGPTSVTYACPDAATYPTLPATNQYGTVTKIGWTETSTYYPTSFPCAGGLTGTGWGQADNRPGGVPDPATVGPDIIRIGNEGGLFQKSVVIPSTPVNYEYNKRSVTVLNVLERGLWLGPAERADVIVDFSAYAGKTLILYNDSGAPVPAGDPRTDYYTGDGDQTGAGGAPNTVAGYGPNSRTLMQINVANMTPDAPFDIGALDAQLLAAYVATQPKPVVPTAEYAPMGGVQGFATNAPYEHIFTGAIYLNKYNALTMPAAADEFYYTPAPVCNTTATCLTTLTNIRKGANSGLVKSVVGQPVSAYVESKAIQELFENDYGRMNATLGVELPFTNVTIQTTIPLAYVDPATETIAQGETQFWKITHNGVDSHPVHFHFINVQVINRVGWDGTIKQIPADEVGWKETVKMHPLEDIIVAVRAKTSPPTPFGMPHSWRQPAPNQLASDNHGITQIDPATGGAPASPYTNNAVDYGSEYVWHCHILGHEENDFMRPFIFKAQEVLAPSFNVLSATGGGASGVTVTWQDPTPVDVTAYDPISNPTGFLGNPQNEIGFRVERAPLDVNHVLIGDYQAVGTGLHTINPITAPINAQANATTYFDSVGTAGSTLATPNAPTYLSQTTTSVTLNLQPQPPVAGATGYDVYRNGVRIAQNAPAGDYVDTTAVAGNTYAYTIVAVSGNAAAGYSYRVVAVTAAGETPSSNAQEIGASGTTNSAQSAATTVVMGPVVVTGITVTNPTASTLTVNWPPVAGAAKYLVSQNGAAGALATSPDTVKGLLANTTYSFTVTAVNASNVSGPVSAPASGLTLPDTPTLLTVGVITDTTEALSWTAPANSVGVSYSVSYGLPGAPAPLGSASFNGTSGVVSGLAPNTTYSFTVSAVNASGPGAASGSATALTRPGVPGTPGPTAIAADNISLTWTAPQNGAASYTVQYSSTGVAPWTNAPVVLGTAANIAGLTPTTSYTFRVFGTNATGDGNPSGLQVVKTADATVIPSVPDCCTATSATSTSVVVNWVASAAGPAASYTVQRATNLAFTRGLQTTLNVAGTNLPVTGLNPNVTYYFRVLAVNALGSSAYSNVFTFQPPAPPATPAAPAAATTSPVSTAAPTITLTFAAPVAGTTYTINQQSRASVAVAWGAATVVATGVTGTTWTTTGLAPDNQYRYFLVAVGPTGISRNSPVSNALMVRQMAAAPTGFTVVNDVAPVTTGVGTRTVVLNWTVPANGANVTSIRVRRLAGTTIVGPAATVVLAANATTLTVTGLLRNTNYTFQVQTVTAGGVSSSPMQTILTLP